MIVLKMLAITLEIFW